MDARSHSVKYSVKAVLFCAPQCHFSWFYVSATFRTVLSSLYPSDVWELLIQAYIMLIYQFQSYDDTFRCTIRSDVTNFLLTSINTPFLSNWPTFQELLHVGLVPKINFWNYCFGSTFTGRMPFLSHNRQPQSTEENAFDLPQSCTL